MIAGSAPAAACELPVEAWTTNLKRIDRTPFQHVSRVDEDEAHRARSVRAKNEGLLDIGCFRGAT